MEDALVDVVVVEYNGKSNDDFEVSFNKITWPRTLNWLRKKFHLSLNIIIITWTKHDTKHGPT